MPKKIYARQVPPEQVDTRIYMESVIEDGVVITGNDRMNDVNADIPDLSDESIVDYLSSKYGREYEKREICGCCQGDWNYMYAPKEYCTGEYIRYVEAVYFGTGTELEIMETEGEIKGPEDIEGTYDYFSEYDLEKAVKERYGDAETVLWLFDGWKRTPKYKRAE